MSKCWCLFIKKVPLLRFINHFKSIYMKQIFTSISLAAMTFLAATPAVAQQRTLTDREKAAVIEAVVPAMLEQTGQISGIDFSSLANPNIEAIIASPLFGIGSTLRAESLTPLKIHPDSMMINLEAISAIPPMVTTIIGKSLRIDFADYKEYNLTTAKGRTIALSIPQTISTSVMGSPVTLKFTIGEQTGLLPFNTLSADLDLGSLSALTESIGIKSGKLFSLKESASSAGVYTYNVNLGETMLALLTKLTSSEAIAQVPQYIITADMTQMQTGLIEASVAGVPAAAPIAQVPLGDAQVYLNLKAMSPDSIILTSYTQGQKEGYRKLVPQMEQKSAQELVITTQDFSKKTENAAWIWTATERISMTDRTKAPATSAILPELITRTLTEFANTGSIAPYTLTMSITKDANGDGVENSGDLTVDVLNIDVVPSMGATEAVVGFNISTPNEAGALTESMLIQAKLPYATQTLSVNFMPVALGDTPVGTMYVQSNVMQIATGNEAISGPEELSIRVADGGLYIQNCEKGSYTIVGMNARPLAQGIISGTGAFIPTPALTRGNIYILTIVENGIAQSIKFKK